MWRVDDGADSLGKIHGKGPVHAVEPDFCFGSYRYEFFLSLSRQVGVTKVEMQGKKAKVTYNPETTDEKAIIEGFNKDGGRYKASKS